MIRFYSSFSSSSSRKARHWLTNHKLEFLEIKINSHHFTDIEIKHILSLTESGTDDIISKHCNGYKNIAPFLNDLTLNELVDKINQSPSLLKRPLLIDDKRLQVGFNEEQLRKFLPRDFRHAEKENFLNRIDI
ncbi:transcriptional regulator Spx [Lactococcus lactis]|uniref:Spx/MgsR family RNA polymerase-binding regulatory protein n=1 Tax=Lactococcus lactis TaxID=1358 RepID=A0A9X4NPK8_9LACT|nr:Spx/MgsR family RNA polymerase-binding regulatory protein [Lactococcus lactis]MBK5076277.1 transcriptional regulator Spx [Lactococcus lactis]MDG4983926.1 Spx/MgsR family RNA polymerase-binding regulatory protein [Lactococcus lactis]WDA68710.1 Spx/MgsR family RNA polymerase-binding regulatory protein [Lactococcus lactis]WDA68880.1 Spx/MgsR family RNA polymerase-binding regulatory protein [Lactococcus lactis]